MGSQESLGVEGWLKTEMVGSMVIRLMGYFTYLEMGYIGYYNPLILTSVPGHPSRRRWMVGWVGVNITSLKFGY